MSRNVMRAVLTAIRASERTRAATPDHQQAAIDEQRPPGAAGGSLLNSDPPDDRSGLHLNVTPPAGKLAAAYVLPVRSGDFTLLSDHRSWPLPTGYQPVVQPSRRVASP
jgi:hypothetical protein